MNSNEFCLSWGCQLSRRGMKLPEPGTSLDRSLQSGSLRSNPLFGGSPPFRGGPRLPIKHKRFSPGLESAALRSFQFILMCSQAREPHESEAAALAALLRKKRQEGWEACCLGHGDRATLLQRKGGLPCVGLCRLFVIS